MLIRFDAYAGVFVSHCHNLEHEDGGMMQNLEVLPPVPVRVGITRQADGVRVSIPVSALEFVLEVAETLGPGARWTQVPQTQTPNGDTLSVTVAASSGSRFYRLSKTTPAPDQEDDHSAHH